MDGKITIELDYHESLGTVYLTHPDLDEQLTFRASSTRLAQIQLDTLNLARPKTPIDEIVTDSQELIEAVSGLKQLVPEIIAALKGKK